MPPRSSARVAGKRKAEDEYQPNSPEADRKTPAPKKAKLKAAEEAVEATDRNTPAPKKAKGKATEEPVETTKKTNTRFKKTSATVAGSSKSNDKPTTAASNSKNKESSAIAASKSKGKSKEKSAATSKSLDIKSKERSSETTNKVKSKATKKTARATNRLEDIAESEEENTDKMVDATEKLRLDLEEAKLLNKELQAQIDKLKEKAELEKSLVAAGVAMRRHWYDAFEVAHGKPGNADVQMEALMVWAGGNLQADMAMFKLGYMKPSETDPNNAAGDAEIDETYKAYFNRFYANDYDFLLSVSHDNFKRWSRKMVELCNMSATIAFNCGYVADQDTGDEELERFRRLAIECARDEERLAALHPDPETRMVAYDAWPTVEEKMREITKLYNSICARKATVPSE
ncbi:uncharacterized protein L3040_007089 [Drepanopeziza brunnea f. sp. 'multigermtubi']|uniref:uncharacterized protein n=1 Tax=Drepanopeziza brunnea f. sp. 'multigermtubi' TaxID=698441 RepID=UPI00239793FD|nr:hypothetical protein L3040_007089 [Drepanopeziza brunnea f. sp. 'multigermtubi']